MSKSSVLLYLLLSFIIGVFVRSFFVIDQVVCFFLLISSLIFLFAFYQIPKVTVSSFAMGFFVCGIFLTNNSLEKVNNLFYVNKTFDTQALVIKSTPSTLGQNVIVEFLKLKIDTLLSLPKYPEYKYGDLLEISCTAKAIENTDAEFDYRMYMAKENVFYKCDKPKVSKVSEGRGNFLYQKILEIRSSFEDKILQTIAQPEGALADGLLFGGNAGLSKEIQNDFSKTGMTHIVAVSGYNVTIIAEYLILLGIFLGLWRNQAIWFAIVGVILFVIMSGLPASAVRAGVMGMVLLWAMKNGRITSAENAVIFAAAIMLFQNPLLLRYDVGFQLSFLATLGIVTTSAFWEKSFVKKYQALGIIEAIALSLSAQIFVLPIIAYNFHITSLVSLLANIFVLPIIPLSMLLVFMTSLAGFVFVPLSLVFAWLTYLPLFYEITLIHVLAQFPWASISMEKISAWWIFDYYCILIILIYYLKSCRAK